MTGNKAVAYKGPGKVELIDIDYPTFELKDGPGVNPANVGRKVPPRRHPQDRHHQHLRLRPAHGPRPHHRTRRTSCSATRSPARSSRSARTSSSSRSATSVSVPFNIACGRCRNCKERKTGICLNVNPDRPGSAYGYVDMGGWVGGQAEYVLVPYADWNLLKFPDRDQALEKIMDLTMLSDIFPTGFHGAVTAGVGVGSTVYVAGAGPVGLAAAISAQLLGAAVVIVGDMNADRLAQARSFGCETVDLTKGDPAEQIEQILGVPEVDCGVDAVGFEAQGPRRAMRHEAPATVLNSLMDVTAAGGALGIPGLYVTGDPGGVDEAAQEGLALHQPRYRLGEVAVASPPGQCPVMKYNRGLMMAILHDKVHIAEERQRQGDHRWRTRRRATPSSTPAPPRSTCSTRTAT